MNCLEFEAGLREAAGVPAFPIERRERLRRHAASCASCAGPWAAEEALTNRLAEFGAATANERASLRVRHALRQELRATLAAAPAETANVLPFAPRRRMLPPTSRNGRNGMLAAAAALAAIFALAGWFWQRASTDAKRPQIDDIAIQAPPAPPAPSIDAMPPAPPLPASPEPRRARPKRSANASSELASEFVPLTLAADERAIENGTLVRLEMSRERLIAMGLPLQIESAQKTLNAEVLMGDNGVAYAIRVVR